MKNVQMKSLVEDTTWRFHINKDRCSGVNFRVPNSAHVILPKHTSSYSWSGDFYGMPALYPVWRLCSLLGRFLENFRTLFGQQFQLWNFLEIQLEFLGSEEGFQNSHNRLENGKFLQKQSVQT